MIVGSKFSSDSFIATKVFSVFLESRLVPQYLAWYLIREYSREIDDAYLEPERGNLHAQKALLNNFREPQNAL